MEERGLALGAADFIAKPIRPAIVAARVRTQLRLKLALDGLKLQVAHMAELKETQAALRRESELQEQIEDHAAPLKALLRGRTEMLNVLAHEVRHHQTARQSGLWAEPTETSLRNVARVAPAASWWSTPPS